MRTSLFHKNNQLRNRTIERMERLLTPSNRLHFMVRMIENGKDNLITDSNPKININ